MQLTPATKGQLTKAVNAMRNRGACEATRFVTIRSIFRRAGMPRQQAKHATRKFIAELGLTR